MPAFNAQATVRKTFDDIPHEIVDEIILVDDNSTDGTAEIAYSLGINVIRHCKNIGYGANQKTCYQEALKNGADVIVMLHPDYQYDSTLVPALASMVAYSNYDCAIASRMLLKSAIEGKMPKYKYFANKFLTFFQNLLLNKNLSEYHRGYRAFSREVLENIDFMNFSDDFIFDNQMLASICYKNYSIGEISCPTRYFKHSSSINFSRSVVYGLGVLRISIQYVLAKLGIKKGIFK